MDWLYRNIYYIAGGFCGLCFVIGWIYAGIGGGLLLSAVSALCITLRALP